jgi:UDP-2,3-diacylglucosamine hydrolase
MPRSLFISDLHLDPSRPATVRALADLLTENHNCDALYILGDLFEAWVGDDEDTSLADSVRDMLRAFSSAGPALYIMVGNRDFLLGEAFCAEVGATLLPDPTVIDLYGTPTLLMHGDSLCTRDADYQAFRRTARDPQWQRELLSQPLEARRALAAQLRATSRDANSNKAEDIMDVTASEVAREMAQHNCQQLIHGHTHRPQCHQEAGGTRWVLGDWEATGWKLEVAPEKFDLIEFKINQ